METTRPSYDAQLGARKGDVVHSFVKSYAPLADAVHDPSIVYDEDERQYKSKNQISPTNLYQIVDDEKGNFCQALYAFQKKATKAGDIVVVDDKLEVVPHSFKEVQEWIEASRREYSKEKNGHNMVTRSLNLYVKTIGDNGKAFEAWLDILPNGEYSSLICGTFKLILSTAIHIASVREVIFKALASIPGSFNQALIVTGAYRSKLLHETCSKMYKLILEAYTLILEWLKEKLWKKVVGAFLRQGSYGSDLKQKIEEVVAAAKNVRQEAQVCAHVRLGEVKDAQKYQIFQMQELTSKMDLVYEKVGALTNFTRLFQDNMREWNPHRMKIEAGSGNDKITKEKLTPSALLKKLSHNSTAASEDLQDIHSITRNTMSAKAYSLARVATSNDTVLNWSTSRGTEALLMIGTSECEGSVTAMSFIAYMMATTARRFKNFILLTYFCGLHLPDDSRDSESPVSAMISSLLGQLLSQYDGFDVSFVKKNFKLADIRTKDLNTLCVIFTTLLKQLPEKLVIFCIVDGIYEYEISGDGNACSAAFSDLVALGEDNDMQASLKLLVTTPADGEYVREAFSEHAILELEGLEYERGYGDQESFLRESDQDDDEEEEDRNTDVGNQDDDWDESD